MTPAGHAGLPDLSAPFEPASDILAAIDARASAKAHFESFPDLYIRVRISYIEEMRKRPEEFARRLDAFLRKTEAGQMFGNWNDGGRLA
ncbi:MAG: YdeI/OmpD-associated family protein [Isosphaeraceae bacterium]|nr:YdeI/OmpD-associated family protein [Isosphaeraceae bacterium]